jgi:hypothetical protein
MKKSIIIIGVLLCGHFLYSQSYIPFPSTFATWSIYHEIVTVPPNVYASMHYYTIDGDTLIDNELYKKVFYQYLKSDNTLNNPTYTGALREDDNKNIWYLNYNQPFGDTNLRLLYNFNIDPSDTIYYSNPEYYPPVTSYFVVVDTGQMNLGGELRKTYTITREDEIEDTWVEGVGSLNGLFSLHTEYFEQRWDLSCFQIDYVPFYENLSGNLFWLYNGLNPCYTSLVVDVDEEDIVKKGKLNVYPNPFTTATTIEYKLKEISDIQFTVYNLQGVVVYETEERLVQPGTHKVTWSQSHLPAGMYYGVMRSDEGVSVVKMMKR